MPFGRPVKFFGLTVGTEGQGPEIVIEGLRDVNATAPGLAEDRRYPERPAGAGMIVDSRAAKPRQASQPYLPTR